MKNIISYINSCHSRHSCHSLMRKNQKVSTSNILFATASGSLRDHKRPYYPPPKPAENLTFRGLPVGFSRSLHATEMLRNFRRALVTPRLKVCQPSANPRPPNFANFTLQKLSFWYNFCCKICIYTKKIVSLQRKLRRECSKHRKRN